MPSLPEKARIALEVLAVVIVIGVLGWVNVPMPLHGDAALYQLGAKALAAGEMIYRDFWDLKQPGIYLFHWTAGSTFGFTESGLHAFELLYMLGLAALQLIVIRRHLALPWLAPAVPLLSIGAYYAISTEWHLTQPAVLLSAPLFCLVALLAAPASAWRSTLAGAAGAVAVLFKFAVAPVVLILFATSWVIDRHASGRAATRVWLDRLMPALAGAAVVSGGVTLWLFQHDALGSFAWVLHTWTPLALEVRGAHPLGRVLSSSLWFVLAFAPQLLLSLFARERWRGWAGERLFVLAFAWLVAGLTSVLTEPFAGWEFDFLMLGTPLALLAVRGLEGLLLSIGVALTPRLALRAAVVLAALALAPTAAPWSHKALRMLAHASLASADDHAFQRAVSPRYEQVWQSTAFLRADGSTPGPIYVFGDPLIHTLSRRTNASSIHGWAWELQPAIIWERLERELRQQPPAFIFAEQGYDIMLTERSPALRAMLDRDYAVHAVDDLGTWYARRNTES